MQIVEAHSGVRLEAARRLFAEYVSTLDFDLEYQGFSAELASLPGRFAPPAGGMWIAEIDRREGAAGADAASSAAGTVEAIACVAMRALPELGAGVCELKRMYVRPAYRGLGLGRKLGETVVNAAREAGYSLIKLDTERTFVQAVGLYRSMGFLECERYNNDPMPDTMWMELRLGGGKRVEAQRMV